MTSIMSLVPAFKREGHNQCQSDFSSAHKTIDKVEDFLARRPNGVSFITLSAKAAKHQIQAAEAAKDLGLHVLYDPRTDRMAAADPDGQLEGLPAYGGALLDLDTLASNPVRREELVIRTIESHPGTATIVTPPWFFIDSERTARLAVDLAELTRLASDRPVRAVLTISDKLTSSLVDTIADELARAQVRDVDIRVSPTSAEADSLRKVRRVFAILDAFSSRGFSVNMGMAGNLGQVAVALGHASTFSVGIGQGEHVDQRATLRHQVSPQPKRYDEDGKEKRGQWEGIYLPGLAATTSRKIGTALLRHSDIRTRIGCRTEECANSVAGPLVDSRRYYLHARTHEISVLEGRPEKWRAQAELERLQRALSLRQLINQRYWTEKGPGLPTRTLESLLDDIREAQSKVA